MLVDALKRASVALRWRRSTAIVPFEGGDAVVVAEPAQPDRHSIDSSCSSQPATGREAASSGGGQGARGNAASGRGVHAWSSDTPEVVPEPTARPEKGSTPRDTTQGGEAQRQLQALRECCEALEARLEESQERVLKLEVELRSERLLSRRALDEAAAARASAERTSICRECGKKCGEPERASGVLSPPPTQEPMPRRKRRDRCTSGSKVAFEDCPEVITVEIEGGKTLRESRRRQSTGIGAKIVDFPSQQETCTSPEPSTSVATSSWCASDHVKSLKKSRERVPTGQQCWEQLKALGLLVDDEPGAGGASSSSAPAQPLAEPPAEPPVEPSVRAGAAVVRTSPSAVCADTSGGSSGDADGRGVLAPAGQHRRRARAHAMSCQYNRREPPYSENLDEQDSGSKSPDASRGLTMVLPPNMRRRQEDTIGPLPPLRRPSTERQKDLPSQDDGTCRSLVKERGKYRRASSIASFNSGSSDSQAGKQQALVESAAMKIGFQSEASSCSTVPRSPRTDERDRRRQSRISELQAVAALIAESARQDAAANSETNVTLTSSEPSSGTGGPSARGSIASGSTGATAVAPCATDGERSGVQARRARAKTHSAFVSMELVVSALGSGGGSRPSSARSSMVSAIVPPPPVAPPPLLLGELEQPRLTKKGRQLPKCRGFDDPHAHVEHLGVLARYSSWRVPQALPPDEPPGVLCKGGPSTPPISRADAELLIKAVPELKALGLGKEVAAHCFRAFTMEAGEVLWCEDEPTDQIFVVGAGASLGLTRFGRTMRDVVEGEGLGTEALQHQCRWAHKATVKTEGEIWVLEVAAIRELLAAMKGEENFRQVFLTLSAAPLLRRLLPLQLAVLAAHAEAATVRKDELLARSGESRATFFVVNQGALAVLEDGKEVRRYRGVGQCFGERALLNTARGRELKVVATEPSSVMLLREELLAMALGSKLTQLLQRSAARQALHNLAARDRSFEGVQPETLELWAENCSVQALSPSADLLQEAVSGMLLVLSGELSACEKPDGSSMLAQQFEALGCEHLLERPSEWLGSLRAGYAGAAVAFLPCQRHDEVFEHCERLSEVIAYQKRVALVREIFIFRHLTDGQCSTLVRSMSFVTRRRGEVVVREGDQGAEFYIIHQGDVHVSKNCNFITKLSQADYFGERALVYEELRAATVTVSSETATFCVLTKRSFLEVLNGGVLDFIAYRNKLLDTDLQFSDLEMQKVIGRGGYGIVKLVRHKISGTRYALKCVTREKLSDQDRSLVQRERAILQLIDHPFCLKLVRSFKDDNCVYFLTELVTGGELLDALDRLDVLNHEQAQFYFGSLVVIFEYVHQKNVVYRDLKPENVLLDQDGFVKLIDFGAARRLDGPTQKCYTLLGTPYFMAAEMLSGKGYDMRVDIWALGVCLYEFVVGRLPFDGDGSEAIFRQVASKHPVEIPEKNIDQSSHGMLKWLLQKDPSERPDASAKGYKAVREHAFFEGFNFEALINRKVRPPLVPQGEVYSEELSSPPPPTLEAECSPWRDASLHVSVDGWDAEF